MRRAMDYAKAFDATLVSHCEDEALVGKGVVNEGVVSTRLGMPGWPAAGENVMVARDIALAELTGCRVHIAHVSTSGALQLIREAKSRGVAVTCEVTPHHFALTDVDVGEYDTNCKMNPPLRSASDREAILVALADGTVDAIATDHAPHALHEKCIEFERAAFGITGLETALGLAVTRLHREQGIPLARIVELFTSGPARVVDLRGRGTLARGSFADLTIFDPKKRWTFARAKSHSKSHNTPFDGWQLTGKAVATIVGGRMVYRAD
jgi:dihydroorotase